MDSLYVLMPQAQPWWWKRFVRVVNNRVLDLLYFLRHLTMFGILFFVLGFWLLVMGIWVRQFSSKVVRVYWGFVGLYFVVGFWLLS